MAGRFRSMPPVLVVVPSPTVAGIHRLATVLRGEAIAER
jgi:hypothetical protein